MRLETLDFILRDDIVELQNINEGFWVNGPLKNDNVYINHYYFEFFVVKTLILWNFNQWL